MPFILWRLFQNLKTQKSAEGKKKKNHPRSQLPESTNVHLSSFLFSFMAIKEIRTTDAVRLSPARSAPPTPLLWRGHKVLGHFSWGSPSLLHRRACGNGQHSTACLKMYAERSNFVSTVLQYFVTYMPLQHAQSLCCVRLFAALWTVGPQAPLSMGLSRREYWSGLPCPPPEDLPHPGIEPKSPALQAHSLPLSYEGSPSYEYTCILFIRST